jgi:hypothetical protein
MPFAYRFRALVLTGAVVAFATIGSGSASAQPTFTPPSLTPPTTPPPAAGVRTKLVGPPGVKPKQPGTAIFLSLSSTVVSYVLVMTASPASFVGIAGVIVGPSVGHWYAGRGNAGGILLRTTASIMLTAGILRAFGNEGRDCLGATAEQCAEWEDEWKRDDRDTAIIVFGSLGVLAASSVWDIGTAGRSARRWNEAHGVTVAPVILPAAGGNAPGLVIGGRF